MSGFWQVEWCMRAQVDVRHLRSVSTGRSSKRLCHVRLIPIRRSLAHLLPIERLQSALQLLPTLFYGAGQPDGLRQGQLIMVSAMEH